MTSAHRSIVEDVPGVEAVLPYQAAHVRLPDDSPGVVYAAPLTEAERAGVADLVRVADVSRDPRAFTRTLAAGEIAASRFAMRSLDLDIGDEVTLPTPTGPRAFRVGADFEDWAFRGTFYVDLDTYRSAWGDDAAYRYAVVPTADASVDELGDDIDGALRASSVPAHVVTRDEAVADLVTYTTTFFPLFRALTLASFVLAALALANAAFTTLAERRWLFALQRALGMTTREVVRSLALEAVVVGLVAAIGATILGVTLGGFLMGTMSDAVTVTFGITVPWTTVAAASVLGIGVALGATWFPRRTARRATIVESLRFD
jgi:putative ABC transport system permease protein